MPSDAPKIKIRKTQEYGAEVIFYDRDENNREEIGFSIAMKEGRKLIKPFDDLNVIYGQGTAALEVMNEVDTKFDMSVVCCSGGGLAAGTGIVFRTIPVPAAKPPPLQQTTDISNFVSTSFITSKAAVP